MRSATILAAVLLMTATSIANAGSTEAVSVRDYPTMEVSPPVRSASYYSVHHSERDLVARLCLYSRVADGSRRACENVLKSGALEIEAVLLPGYGCSGIPVC